MEAWLAEQYIHSPWQPPGAAMQGFLNLWVKISHLMPSVRDIFPSETRDEPESIALESECLMNRHYNMSLALFKAILGKSMKYSMALWEKGAGSLDQAQEDMLDDLCQKLGVHDGSQILDIGCGFGSFASHVLRRHPRAHVDGLNLSDVHCQYIRGKRTEAGHPLHTDRFQLVQGDFNKFQTDQSYDYVVSIGFFEHVSNLGLALERIRHVLRPGGRCFLHYIVRQGADPCTTTRPSRGFIQKHIFPGSRIHAFEQIFRDQGGLKLEQSWFLNGINYQKTLEAWLQNFLDQRDKIRREAGLDDEALKMWELYLRGCIAVFHMRGGRYYGNAQYLFTREQV